MRTVILISFVLSALTTASVHAQEDQCTGIVSNDPERMYDFKVGDWDISWRNRNGAGGFFEFEAQGHVYHLMDNDILMDEQTSDYFKGVTFRTWNPQTSQWIVRWLPANSTFDHPISAQLEDCVPVERHNQLAPDGREVEVYTRFVDITEDSFSFRQNWSFDGGDTWVEDVLYYDARRAERSH